MRRLIIIVNDENVVKFVGLEHKSGSCYYEEKYQGTSKVIEEEGTSYLLGFYKKAFELQDNTIFKKAGLPYVFDKSIAKPLFINGKEVKETVPQVRKKRVIICKAI